MLSYTSKAFKTLLNKRKFIDPWFWDRYSINPYQGCQFGCIYCDARSAQYHLPTDFENQIVIKEQVNSILDQRISRARTLLPDIVSLSGTTDPYQPAEKQYRNTRQCLEVLAQHGYPVHIITKSRLVLEDADLLEEIAAKSWASVSMTITTTDPEVSRFLEQRASLPEARFEILEALKAKCPHLKVGVLMIPVVPGLSDSPEALHSMVDRSRNAQVDYMLLGGGMTLRDSQALWFLGQLQSQYPELMPYYEALYRFQYRPDLYLGDHSPQGGYGLDLHKRFFALCKAADLAYRIPRFIPQDFRRRNYQIAEKWLNEAYERKHQQQVWKNLFWAGMNIQNLKEDVAAIAQRGELLGIRNVDEALKDDILKYC